MLIGTGDNDSDSKVEVSLVNDKGESNRQQPALGSGRDNYEKGSIEIFDTVNFSLDGKPSQIKVYFEGDKWRIGGLWLTDKSTGETWYVLPNCMIGSAANRSPQTFALEKISEGGLLTATFDTFVVKITTASGKGAGTDNTVFLKIFDAKGNSCITQRPGSVDNVLNPINDWQAGTTQSARISATLTQLGHAHHILLAKYGSDAWMPSAVTVEV